MKARLGLLDDTDRAILRLLLEDGRIPFSRIAKQLGVSEATVHLRLKRLRMLGVLKGFHADVDPSLVGYPIVAFIFVKASPDRLSKVAGEIAKMDGVFEVHLISGEYQLMVKVRSTSSEGVANLAEAIGRLNGVSSMAIYEVLKTFKEEHNIPL